MREWSIDEGERYEAHILVDGNTAFYCPHEYAQFIVDACNVRERAMFILENPDVAEKWAGNTTRLAEIHGIQP